MRVYLPIVEQLSQLFLNNWDNCSTLVYSYLPVALRHSCHGEAFNEGPQQKAYLMGGTGDISFPVTTNNETVHGSQVRAGGSQALVGTTAKWPASCGEHRVGHAPCDRTRFDQQF